MSKEAMKLALEALQNELSIDWTNNEEFNASAEQMYAAIKALEEALAKQEQGEPVLWGVQLPDGKFSPYAHLEKGHAEIIAANSHKGTFAAPLYTTPQQRTLVELTDEEVFETFGNFSAMTGKSWLDLYRITEAKRKEKNT
jgi:hypothetical protein